MTTSDKKHLGNARLSYSGQSIKIHIFTPEAFYVIPLREIHLKKVGRISEYKDGNPEIVGECIAPKKGGFLWSLKIKTSIFYFRDTYMQLLLGNTSLSLGIYEE
jgi:hypothetical protein